jgi:hypothetical protein
MSSGNLTCNAAYFNRSLPTHDHYIAKCVVLDISQPYSPYSFTSFFLLFKAKVKLRPTASRPVCLGARHPSGARNQLFYLLEIFFRQLRVCYFVEPSLTRVWVCNLLLLLVLASAVSGTRPYFIAPIFETLPNLEGQVPVFISPRNRVAQIYPWALGSLSVASYDSQDYGGGILSRPPPLGKCCLHCV